MRILFSLVCCLAIVPSSAFASGGSELDSIGAPKLVVKKLDPTNGVVTSYRVEEVDSALHPDTLRGLSESERKARVDAFLKTIVKPENKIGEEKVTAVQSELDGAGSTSAWWGRWRGYGGYYGSSYYGYYGGYSYYYRPYWGYSSYGYYSPYYSGYYGGYGRYGYSYGYYPYYTLYGYNW